MRKYLHKKCYAFLAQVVDKRSKGKEIKDVPQVCDFINVFLEDLPELPHAISNVSNRSGSKSDTSSEIPLSIGIIKDARTLYPTIGTS